MQGSCQITPRSLNQKVGSADTAYRCHSCGTRLAFVQRRPGGRCRREPSRHAGSSSRGSSRQQIPACVAGGQSAAVSLRSPAASADAISTDQAPAIVLGGREFFQWIVDLPWNRLAVWMAVAWFVYQLKDFFGVSDGTIAPTTFESTARAQPPFRTTHSASSLQ